MMKHLPSLKWCELNFAHLETYLCSPLLIHVHAFEYKFYFISSTQQVFFHVTFSLKQVIEFHCSEIQFN